MAGEILDKLSTLLGSRNDDGLFGTKPVFEEAMFDRMFEFIVSLDPEQLSEGQAADVMDIIEDIELEYDNGMDEEDEELDEAAPRRVKRNKQLRRVRSRAYRKVKSKRKMAAKRYRKSGKGKMMAKKSKRMKKQGKTASGKKIRKFY